MRVKVARGGLSCLNKERIRVLRNMQGMSGMIWINIEHVTVAGVSDSRSYGRCTHVVLNFQLQTEECQNESAR